MPRLVAAATKPGNGTSLPTAWARHVAQAPANVFLCWCPRKATPRDSTARWQRVPTGLELWTAAQAGTAAGHTGQGSSPDQCSLSERVSGWHSVAQVSCTAPVISPVYLALASAALGWTTVNPTLLLGRLLQTACRTPCAEASHRLYTQLQCQDSLEPVGSCAGSVRQPRNCNLPAAWPGAQRNCGSKYIACTSVSAALSNLGSTHPVARGSDCVCTGKDIQRRAA